MQLNIQISQAINLRRSDIEVFLYGSFLSKFRSGERRIMKTSRIYPTKWDLFAAQLVYVMELRFLFVSCMHLLRLYFCRKIPLQLVTTVSHTLKCRFIQLAETKVLCFFSAHVLHAFDQKPKYCIIPREAKMATARRSFAFWFASELNYMHCSPAGRGLCGPMTCEDH